MNKQLLERYRQSYVLECQGCQALVMHLHLLKAEKLIYQLCDNCYKKYNQEILRDILFSKVNQH